MNFGATLYLFQCFSSFHSYIPIAKYIVEAASGTSHLLAKDLVWLLLNRGTNLDAYYAPKLESNILAFELLAKFFNVILLDLFFQKLILYLKVNRNSNELKDSTRFI